MATFDYSKTVITADRLITKFGQDMILGSVTEGDYDPATGDSDTSTIETPVIGVIFELSGRLIGKSLQNGSLAEHNDKQCLLTVGTSPNLLDKLMFDSKSFVIINIKELNPGGTTVFYDLVLRNG